MTKSHSKPTNGERDFLIFKDYLDGMPYSMIQEKYKLSLPRLRVIVGNGKKLIGFNRLDKTTIWKNKKKHPLWLKQLAQKLEVTLEYETP